MTTRRTARRDEIARAAVEPMSRRGVVNVTLADIGADLGMSGAHLLYYFSSKADLFQTALRLVEQDLRASVLEEFDRTPSARKRWDLLLATGAPKGLDDSGLLLWLEAWSQAPHDPETHALVTELEAAWQGLLVETLEYAIARGELPASIDAPQTAEAVSALLDGLTMRVVVGYRPLDHAASMRIVDQLFAPRLPWSEPPTGGLT